MKKFLLLAAMVLVCAGAASAQSKTGQQGQGGTVESRDNARSSDLEGSKYGAASEPGSDGSHMTVSNPDGPASAPVGPSSTTSSGSVSPTAEQLNQDVNRATSNAPPRRRR